MAPLSRSTFARQRCDQSLTIPGTVDVAAYHDTPPSSGAREASYSDGRVFRRRRVEALEREVLIIPDAARVHPDDRIRGCFINAQHPLRRHRTPVTHTTS